MFEKIITRGFFFATFAAVALVLLHGMDAMPRAEPVAVVKLPTVVVTGRAVGAPHRVVLAPRADDSRRSPG